MAMTKAEVREAFREVMAADYADVPKREEIEHTFSPEFYARMDALIAEQRRGTWRMMPRQCKRVLVVAAILAATLILVACSPVLRHAVEMLAVTIYETFVDITVDTDKSELRMEIETVYGLNPLPEGFEITSQEMQSPYRVKTHYQNKNKDKIVIIQSIPGAFLGTTDIEEGNSASKTIKGIEVLFSATGDICTATMIYDGYRITIQYCGQTTLNDFEKLIESLIVVE